MPQGQETLTVMKKRLWWITKDCELTLTGGLKYEDEVAKGLPFKGWDVDRLSLPLERSGPTLKRHFISNFRIAQKLFPLINRGDVIVESTELCSRLFLFNIIAGLLRSARFVAIVHHRAYHGIQASLLFNAIGKCLEALFLRMVHHVVVVSKATKREVVQVGIPEERISIVPDAFDRPPKIYLERNDNRLQLLFVGTCHPRKGLEHLLEAMRRLGDRDIVLNLVGNLEDSIGHTKHIQSLVEEYGLERKIVFHGWISEEELWKQYARSDLFVLPSLWEGFGIVLLEAMSFGLPIVTTNTGAIPELIKDEWNGLLVPPRDSKALAAAIARLGDNPGLREKLGRNALSRSKAAMTWKQVSKQFSDVLNRFV